MKAIIETISPNGNAVRFETPEESLDELLKHLPALERKLTTVGYQPNATREWPKTPEGNPICPKHGAPMKKREKQGDTWYSHQIVDPKTGEECWCKGYADKSSPGWEIDN